MLVKLCFVLALLILTTATAPLSLALSSTPVTVHDAYFYAVLGIDKNATQTDIRRAYHAKSKALHPDRGVSPSAFTELVEVRWTVVHCCRYCKESCIFDQRLDLQQHLL